MKLLLVEDEPALRTALLGSLKQAGYLVEVAAGFIQAKEKLLVYQYDCVLLDLTLPDGHKIVKAMTPNTGRHYR